MYRSTVYSVVVLFVLSACKTDESLSVNEALKLTTDVQTKQFTPPPRSIVDITAILDEAEAVDLSSIYKLRRKANAEPPSSGHAGDMANFYHRRSGAAFALGRHVQALKDARKAASYVPQIRRRGIRKLSAGGTVRLAGYVARWAKMEAIFGNYRKAKGLVESGLVEARRIRKRGAGQVLKFTNDAINIYGRTGDIAAIEAAVLQAQGALDKFSRVKRGATRKKLQTQIYRAAWKAELLEQKGQWRKAEPVRRQEIELRDKMAKLDSIRGVGFVLSPRARLTKNLVAQGRLMEAEVEARAALRTMLSRVGKYSFGTVKYTNILANVIAAQGRYGDAQKLLQAAFEILGKLKAPAGSAVLERVRVLSGRMYAAAGNWSSAMSMFDEAKRNLLENTAVFDELIATRPSYQLSLVRSARAHEAVRLINEQLNAQKARSATSSRLAMKHGILAMAYVEIGDAENALRSFARAVPALAAKSAKQASGNAIKSQWRLAVLDAYLNFLAEVRETELEADLPRPAVAEMFRIAEMVRGGSVQTALSGSAARSASGDERMSGIVRSEQDIAVRLETLLETMGRLLTAPKAEQDEQVIASYRDEVEKLRSAQSALQKEIAEKFPEYADLVRPKALTIEQAVSLLRRDEALVSFYVGDEKSYVWALNGQGENAFAVVPIGEGDLKQIVARLRNALDPGSIRHLRDIPRFDLDGAYALYKNLLDPVSAGWKSSKHLMVVSDGALGQLPLSLLPTMEAKERFDEGLLFRHYRSVEWLARSHSVVMLPSVASLKALRNVQITAGERLPFLGIGDPYFNGKQAREAQLASAKTITSRGVAVRSAPQTRGNSSAVLADLPRLPDTRTELLSIAKALKADLGRDLFLGDKADETRVKTMDLARYGVISFATHGLVPGDLNGLEQPALALSAPQVTGSGGDGLLAMDEVLGLKLNADWAVLSACNTAAADGKAAEAVSGLGRAFFYAGARSLLVSNWPVMSEATTRLMVELFENTSAANKGEALRRARIRMIDELAVRDAEGRVAYAYSHPIFWAPFVIVGDNGNSKSGS